ncbi:response regulator [Neolewinella persica]|uniref:response regulator transcription factor n=1 Tax=Neolewinella persica TaxID=70998 RepID=UPI00036B623E|nr:response regulator transcription factor [Neolewinella persica]
MRKHTTALLIEDFPILARYYREALKSYFDEVILVDNTTDALKALEAQPVDAPFNLAILHETISDKGKNNRIDGFALALELKSRHPDTRLLYSINRLSTYLIGSIIREIAPEALVFRPDLSEVEFVHAIKSIQSGKPYHSPSIVPHMHYDIAGSSLVDRIDRNILHYLGQGARTKDLPRLIALSLPSIEKRKKQLKNLLNDPESDYQLILAARKQGLI